MVRVRKHWSTSNVRVGYCRPTTLLIEVGKCRAHLTSRSGAAAVSSVCQLTAGRPERPEVTAGHVTVAPGRRTRATAPHPPTSTDRPEPVGAVTIRAMFGTGERILLCMKISKRSDQKITLKTAHFFIGTRQNERYI